MRTRGVVVLVRLRVAVTLTALSLAAVAAAGQHWHASAALLLIFSSQTSKPLAVGCTGLAAYLSLESLWIAVPNLALLLLTEASVRRRTLRPVGPFQPDALVAAVDGLPFTVSAGDGLVTTLDLIEAARRQTSQRHDDELPRRRCEGGPISTAQGDWTICAAEAALVAAHLPGRLDIHRVALAACIVPNASVTIESSAAAYEAMGLRLGHLTKALTTASKAAGGELLGPRVRHAAEGEYGLDKLPEIDEAGWRKLTGEPPVPPSDPFRGGSGTPGGSVTTGSTGGPGSSAEPRHQTTSDRPRPAPGPTPNPEPKPVVSPAQRPAPTRTSPVEATPGTAPATHPTVTSTREAQPQAHPSSASPPKTTGGRTERLSRAQRLGSVGRALLIAWLTRAPLRIGAAAFLAWHGVAAWGNVAAIAAVLTVRASRHPALLLGVAAAIAPMSLVASTLLAIHALTGQILAWLWSRRFNVPMRGVAGTVRRELFGLPDLDQAWTDLRERFDGLDRDEALDETVLVAAAAWASAEALTQLCTYRRLGLGLLFGRWPFPAMPSFEQTFMLLVVREQITGFLLRASAGVAAAGFAFLHGLTPHAVFGVKPWSLLLPLLCGLVASTAADRGFVLTGPLMFSVLLLATAHATALLPIGVALALAYATRRIRAFLEVRSLSRPRPRLRYPHRSPLRLRGRLTWAAAAKAHAGFDDATAWQLFRRLADDRGCSDRVRAGATAALASIRLSRSEMQDAVELVEDALALLPEGRRTGDVAAVAAEVAYEIGDRRQAEQLLLSERLTRRQFRRPQLAACQTDLQASADRATAERLHRAQPTGVLRMGRLDELIAIEVRLLHALGQQNPATATARLEELLSFEFDEGLPEQAVAGLLPLLAEARVVLGEFLLADGKRSRAETVLSRVVVDLDRSSASVPRAAALMLLGYAKCTSDPAAALADLSEGIETLEDARGQLRAGENRRSVIERYSSAYESAFRGLELLQKQFPGAGRLAAVLAESLARTALSGTLRRGRLALGPDATELLTLLQTAEEQDPSSSRTAELRMQARSELGTALAAAYLPEPVDLDALRSCAGSSHLLTLRSHKQTASRLQGHAVWIPPGRQPVVVGYDIDDDELLALVGLAGPEARQRQLDEPMLGDALERWTKLAQHLLPEELRTVLTHADDLHVVISADGALATVPWPALAVTHDRLLVEAASTQSLPTLSLLEPATATSVAGPVLVYRDVEDANEDATLDLIADRQECHTLGELLDELPTTGASGVYVAAHGSELGLAQGVSSRDGRRLSAATALAGRWPTWVVFASCVVGTVESRSGEDPLGLPVSCLLAGAESVVGGTCDINAAVTARIASAVAVAASEGVHPAVALRRAQRRFLSEPRRPAAPMRWAALSCLSTRVV